MSGEANTVIGMMEDAKKKINEAEKELNLTVFEKTCSSHLALTNYIRALGNGISVILEASKSQMVDTTKTQELIRQEVIKNLTGVLFKFAITIFSLGLLAYIFTKV